MDHAKKERKSRSRMGTRRVGQRALAGALRVKWGQVDLLPRLEQGEGLVCIGPGKYCFDSKSRGKKEAKACLVKTWWLEKQVHTQGKREGEKRVEWSGVEARSEKERSDPVLLV